MSGPVDDRMAGDFDRIDEMVRRGSNLRRRRLVTTRDLVATQITEIKTMATDRVVELEAAVLYDDDALRQWIGGAA
jgi:hypothetical protein